ncbi:MAG: DNA repair protein RecO [Erysipelotrichia bacterium]|nr:DNA repair protein RecO [Erysipelotrichia bacterium]
MKVIILTANQYKEKDAIVTAIAEKQLITFLARGINNPKSKNSALNNPLTIVDIELVEGNLKYPVLRSSKQLFTPFKVEMDANYLGSLLLIGEMMIHLFPDEEKYKMFACLEEGVETLRKTNDWLMTLLIFMSHVMRVGGFALEVNQCVICGKKQKIVAFSFVDGGFICGNCFHPRIVRDLTKDQMLLLRKIFNARDYHLAGTHYLRADALVLFEKIVAYIQDAFGYRFKNIRLLTI